MFPVPTRRLVLAAVVAAVIALLSPFTLGTGIIVWNGALAFVAALDWALAPSVARIGVERTLPAVMTVGVESPITWRVRNPVGRAVHVAVADELAPSLNAPDRRFSMVVPAEGTAEARTALCPSRRGRFTVGELTVRVDGPLGLVSRQGSRHLPHLLRVHPPFRSRDEAELRINKARILEVGMRSAKGRGGGTDFDQLREYTVDDEFRRVDWAATARAGRPIVRTYRSERNQTVIALLDNGRVMHGRVADVPRVEHAMDAVMMLTAVASRLGDRVGLVAFDRQVRSVVPPAAGGHQLNRVTEALFDLPASLAESDYPGAFTETLARFRRRAMIVLFTDLVEQAVGESLLPALPLLSGHHLLVIAAVRDPAVAEWADSGADDVPGAYRQAAAVAALDERRRTIATLRGLGAVVVDAAPGELASRLADTYLDVKATGRL